MTDHLSVLPRSILCILLTDCTDRDRLKEDCRRIVSILFSFFAGAIVGDSASEGIWIQYAKKRFTPLFTRFGIDITISMYMHHNYCTRFLDHHGSIGVGEHTVEIIHKERLEEINENEVTSNGVCSNDSLSEEFHDHPTETWSTDVLSNESDDDLSETWNEEDLEKGKMVDKAEL